MIIVSYSTRLQSCNYKIRIRKKKAKNHWFHDNMIHKNKLINFIDINTQLLILAEKHLFDYKLKKLALDEHHCNNFSSGITKVK